MWIKEPAGKELEPTLDEAAKILKESDVAAQLLKVNADIDANKPLLKVRALLCVCPRACLCACPYTCICTCLSPCLSTILHRSSV